MKPTQVYIAAVPWVQLLGIAFIVLKLCHVIDWSWWLVTMPFWISAALLLGFIVGVVAFGIVASGFACLFLWIVKLFEKRK